MATICAWRAWSGRGEWAASAGDATGPDQRATWERSAAERRQAPPTFVDDPSRSPQARAEAFVDTVVRELKQSPFFGKGTPELAANALGDLVLGTIAERLHGDLGVAAAMSATLTRRSCAKGLSQEEAILLSSLLLEFPGAATSEAFDCLLSTERGETPVLMTLLDRWRSTRLPETERVKSLRLGAKDERTRLRFLGDEELAAHKDAQERVAVAPTPFDPTHASPPERASDPIDQVHERNPH